MTAALDFTPSRPAVEAWADVERRIVKGALSSGVRRVTELGVQSEEFGDTRARQVWAGALRMIAKGSRSVWLDGSLVSEVATEVPIQHARTAIAWVKEAGDEPDDEAINGLVARLRDRIFSAKVYALAGRLRETVQDGTQENAERGMHLIREMRDLTESRGIGNKEVALVSAVDAWDIFEKQAQEETTSGKRALFGIPTLDRWTRQVPGTMTAVGAESHTGKTGILASACLATARAGSGAAFLSLEDPWEEIVARQAAEVGRFNVEDVRGSQPTLDLPERKRMARMGLVGLPVWGLKIRDRSIDAILSGIRQAASKGCLLVAIDFFQAIKRPPWAGKTDGRRDWLDECLNAILATGAERGVVLMLASQLTKDKTRTRLSMADLRETSSIGESAQSVVMFRVMDRKSVSDPQKVEASIVKAKGCRGAGHGATLVRDDFGVLIEGSSDEWGT